MGFTDHIHKRLTFEVDFRMFAGSNLEKQHAERGKTTGLFTLFEFM